MKDDIQIGPSVKWLSAGIWPNNLASSTLLFIQLINKMEFKDLTASPEDNPNPCRAQEAVPRAAAVAPKAPA